MASTIKSGKPGKPVVRTDLPYEQPSIPDLTKEQHDIVLELLCSLLEPIARYRATAQHAEPKSKKTRKRKRATKNAPEPTPISPISDKHVSPPPLLGAVTIGLNSTSRFLEEQASRGTPQAMIEALNPEQSQNVQNKREQQNVPESKRMMAIFLPKQASEIVYAHLPSLCYTASLANNSSPKIRLVSLNVSAEKKIAASLGVPRAGVIGIMEDAPGATALLEYVREQVPPIEIPWISRALDGDWMSTQVESNATNHSR